MHRGLQFLLWLAKLELSPQGYATDAETSRGQRRLSSALLEDPLHRFTLERLKRVLFGQNPRNQIVSSPDQVRRQVAFFDHATLAADERMLDDVLELAHVPREGVFHQ